MRDPRAIEKPRIDPARVPFERTSAFHRYGARVALPPGDEHAYTKALIEQQGFDGFPLVVSKAELDACVRTGEIELFRGLAAASHADQLRTGPLYVGQGTYGGGIYAAGGANGFEHAAAYAQDPGGRIMRLCVKAGARIGDVDDLTRAMLRERQDAAARGLVGTHGWDALWAKTEVVSVYATYLGYVWSGGLDERRVAGVQSHRPPCPRQGHAAMSAQLSRRVGRLIAYPPLYGLPPDEKLALARLVEPRRTEFEDLPERFRKLILEAEGLRQRHRNTVESGAAHALDQAWDEAVERSSRDDLRAAKASV
jgi:hypothetical protein